MTQFNIEDPRTGETFVVEGTVVLCSTDGCPNQGIEIEVPVHPGGSARCGPCGTMLLETSGDMKHPLAPTSDEQRQEAYRQEADPLFFKWQRGEATEQDWLDAVQSIKNRYPERDIPWI